MCNPVEDDDSIADDERLYRRVNPDWIVSDQITGVQRPSSQAFQNYPGYMAFSVYLSSVHPDPEQLVADFPGYGVVSFTAGEVRALGQGVTKVPEAEYPGHAHVNGEKRKGSVKKGFPRIARWEIDIRTRK